MARGICPFAVWRPTKNHDYASPGENKPLVFVDHIMGGWKATMDGPWLDQSGISAHFGIGKDGSISQYVNIFDASYASGVVGQSPRGNRRGIELYDRSNPRLAQIEREANANWHTVELSSGPKWTMSIGAANAWNIRSISTEHEGLNQNDPWTDAMVAATVKVKRWCNEELMANGYPAIPYSHEGIIGHVDIDHIDRAYCPGPGRPLDKIIALLNGGTPATEEIMQVHNTIATRLQGSTGGVQVTPDMFDVPPPQAKLLRIELYLKAGPGGALQVFHADGKYAGQVGWDGGRYGTVDVTPSFSLQGNGILSQLGVVGFFA